MEKKRPPPPPSPSPSAPSLPSSASVLRLLIDVDTSLSLRLYTLTSPFLPYYLLKSLEVSGDGRLFFPVILSILALPFAVNRNHSPIPARAYPLFIDLLLGALLDLIVIGILKHLIRRPRPVYNKNMFLSFAVDHWSFPSGHSSRVSFIATLFYCYSDLVQDVLKNFAFNHFLVDYLVSVVVIWAMTTSVSRVLLGRHFVFDVLAGMFLGVLEGLFVFGVFNYKNLSLYFSQM